MLDMNKEPRADTQRKLVMSTGECLGQNSRRIENGKQWSFIASGGCDQSTAIIAIPMPAQLPSCQLRALCDKLLPTVQYGVHVLSYIVRYTLEPGNFWLEF